MNAPYKIKAVSDRMAADPSVASHVSGYNQPHVHACAKMQVKCHNTMIMMYFDAGMPVSLYL